jgi:hypothetical protein
MLSAFFAALDPQWNEALRTQTANLHRAAGASRVATATASAELAQTIERAASALAGRPLTLAEKRATLRALAEGAAGGDYPDYVAAEQAAMAVVLLLAETGRERELKPQIDALFDALAQDDRYDAARFEQLLSRLKE